jgi:hypothetical protein
MTIGKTNRRVLTPIRLQRSLLQLQSLIAKHTFAMQGAFLLRCAAL